MNTAPKVALLIETSNSYARGLLGGIVSYVRTHQPWSFYLSEHNRGDRPASWLSRWKGDGIIARIENDAIARALRTLDLPVVDVSAARLIPALPWVETDDAEIARLAAEHFLERGFKHFAFCGEPRFNWSNWRCEHFQKRAQAADRECFVYQARKRPPIDEEDEEELTSHLAEWIHGLPKPVGLFACYDLRGQQVLNACRRLGVPVPDDVAVLAVDNDEVLCELSHPPLSSIIPNTHRTGYEAAKLLDEMMAGRKVAGEAHLIPPLGIAIRQSSDALSIEDRHVARAVHYIRLHACDGINVSDVLKAVPHARRLLENRFRKYLGRTPHQEIVRVQVNRVKQLLIETSLSLQEIAERSGFRHVEYLSVAFKREVGMPPSKYRTKNRP
jgi:LacI family transcriptional regulator